MPEQALYLKWRPLSFDDMVGQEHITRTLRNSLKTGRIRHAYLFSGPRGTGKTTTARLLAKAVNCLNSDPDNRPCNECATCVAINEGRFLDLIEIDAATHTGVDDVRDLRDKIAFTPGEGRYKVYIIDEVHRFTGNAFDALLKTLEEPPDHAIFVLATTEIDKVPATIKSRCLQFEFRRVSMTQVADRLQEITESEGLHIERDALELIARQGTGSVRDSISLLDQIVSDPDEVITLEVTQRVLGTANTRAVRDLVEAVVEGSIPRGLHILNAAVDAGSDPRQFGQQVVEMLRNVLLAQTASSDLVEASAEERIQYEKLAAIIGRGTLLGAIRLFNDAVHDHKGGWQPQLSLELALIESIRGAEPEAPVMIGIQSGTSAQAPARNQPQGQPAEPDVTLVEASAPGTPPVIQLTVVREHWADMLSALFTLNKTAPPIVEKFQALRIDGNTLVLATDNQQFFSRLNVAEKLNIVERALFQVHRIRLRVHLILVDDLAHSAETGESREAADLDDPVLSMGLELGGEINNDDLPGR